MLECCCDAWRHSISVARHGRLHPALAPCPYCGMSTAPSLAAPPAPAHAGSGPHNVCVSVLTFLNITLVLVLPALLVASMAASAPPAEERSEPRQQQQHGVVGAAKWAASKAGATWAAADAQLAALCSTRELPWLHQMLLARSLLSLAWVLSITVGLFHRP